MLELQGYRYRGARAMVILHDRYMRELLTAWKRARAAGSPLPKTEDPDYASYDTLLRHALRASRGYMVWMCEMLGLPDPGIRPAPEAEGIEQEADAYLAHLLERWRAPLQDVPEERFHEPTYPSRWKVHYCIDAMLEHAVMHPIRHLFQLEELGKA